MAPGSKSLSRDISGSLERRANAAMKIIKEKGLCPSVRDSSPVGKARDSVGIDRGSRKGKLEVS